MTTSDCVSEATYDEGNTLTVPCHGHGPKVLGVRNPVCLAVSSQPV
jgi:hypothetical protein